MAAALMAKGVPAQKKQKQQQKQHKQRPEVPQPQLPERRQLFQQLERPQQIRQQAQIQEIVPPAKPRARWVRAPSVVHIMEDSAQLAPLQEMVAPVRRRARWDKSKPAPIPLQIGEVIIPQLEPAPEPPKLPKPRARKQGLLQSPYK